jgi:excisionase family DNA binding protein
VTNSNSGHRTYRPIWPEPRVIDGLVAARTHRSGAHTNGAHSAGTEPADGNGNGSLPNEAITHLLIALSRHMRQLRQDGRHAPAQLEQLTALLATHVRSRHGMPMLDGSCGCGDSPAMPGRLLITKKEAAEQLGVSLRTIERLIAAGRLPLVHVEGAARVRVADLEAYVQGLDADDRTTHLDPAGQPATSHSDRSAAPNPRRSA